MFSKLGRSESKICQKIALEVYFFSLFLALLTATDYSIQTRVLMRKFHYSTLPKMLHEIFRILEPANL